LNKLDQVFICTRTVGSCSQWRN